jgi:site-specific DNA-methyltransferase (adenine-specific)
VPQPYFERDGITLLHGDSKEILPELAADTFDLVVTDPPYLVSYSGRWDGCRVTIAGDADASWLEPVYSEMWRVLKQDALCLTFYGWPHADVSLGSWKRIGFRPVSLIVLVKDRWGFGRFTRSQHEQAYLLAKGHPPRPISAPSDVFDWEQSSPLLHPNQKPLGAISRMLMAYAPQGGCVLDPFCGSGTTLVAARKVGLTAVGIEIDERHCETTAIRLSQQTFDFGSNSASIEQIALPCG